MIALNKSKTLVIDIIPQHEDIVKVRPESVEIIEVNSTSFNYTFMIYALTPGKSNINIIPSKNITK